MKELNITLTINELNLILESLGHQSYIKVYELIDKIQNQAKVQLNGSPAGININNENNGKDVKATADIMTN
jgi:hypothetical protein